MAAQPEKIWKGFNLIGICSHHWIIWCTLLMVSLAGSDSQAGTVSLCSIVIDKSLKKAWPAKEKFQEVQ